MARSRHRSFHDRNRRRVVKSRTSFQLSPLRSNSIKLSIARSFGVDDRLRPSYRKYSPPRTIYGFPAPVRTRFNPYAPKVNYARYEFKVPGRTAVCVRRSMRREVLFATGRSGGGKRRRPRRTEASSISCRR